MKKYSVYLSLLVAVVLFFSSSMAMSTPKATDTKLDFWQVAKVQLVEVGGKLSYQNTQPCGKKGHVYGLGVAPMPYEVAGYTFLYSEVVGAGVELFWYQEDPEYDIVSGVIKCFK